MELVLQREQSKKKKKILIHTIKTHHITFTDKRDFIQQKSTRFTQDEDITLHNVKQNMIQEPVIGYSTQHLISKI